MVCSQERRNTHASAPWAALGKGDQPTVRALIIFRGGESHLALQISKKAVANQRKREVGKRCPEQREGWQTLQPWKCAAKQEGELHVQSSSEDRAVENGGAAAQGGLQPTLGAKPRLGIAVGSSTGTSCYDLTLRTKQRGGGGGHRWTATHLGCEGDMGAAARERRQGNRPFSREGGQQGLKRRQHWFETRAGEHGQLDSVAAALSLLIRAPMTSSMSSRRRRERRGGPCQRVAKASPLS
ncbi:hypothetical protein L7F22_008489 [Adiantum nelumboides]|nr:hypothetical protein [Adiantum nelumboides]